MFDYAGRNEYKEPDITRKRRKIKKAKEAVSMECNKKRQVAMNIVEEALSSTNDMVEINPDGRLLISLNGVMKLLALMSDRQASPECEVAYA